MQTIVIPDNNPNLFLPLVIGLLIVYIGFCIIRIICKIREKKNLQKLLNEIEGRKN